MRGIVFTINAQGTSNSVPPPEDIIEKLGGVSEWVFQLEKGDKTGRLHWQGYAYNTSAKTLQQWRAKLPAGTWIQIMKARTRATAWEYCTKEETRVSVKDLKAMGFPMEMAGPHVHGITLKPKNGGVLDPLADKELYPWQEELVGKLKGPPSTRTIIWVHEPEGGVGKSAFTKHTVLWGGTLVVGGKAADAFHGVAEWLAPKKGGNPKALDRVIVDVPRCQKDYMSYQTLEKVKDGCFFSGKYEGGMAVFNTPHVVVFSNDMPDKSKMSADRWEIYTINSKKELVAEHALFPIFKAQTEEEVKCTSATCTHGAWECSFKAAATCIGIKGPLAPKKRPNVEDEYDEEAAERWAALKRAKKD